MESFITRPPLTLWNVLPKRPVAWPNFNLLPNRIRTLWPDPVPVKAPLVLSILSCRFDRNAEPLKV